jgi:hypothetical protein
MTPASEQEFITLWQQGLETATIAQRLRSSRTQPVEVRCRSLVPSFMRGDPAKGRPMESEEILDALE